MCNVATETCTRYKDTLEVFVDINCEFVYCLLLCK